MHHIVVFLLLVAGTVSAYNEQLIPIHVMAIGLFTLSYIVCMHQLLRD